MTHELEQALVIEASRSGEAGGEATTVLRSLPDDTAEFGALRRFRHPWRRVLAMLLGVLLVAGGIVFAIDRAQRGSTGGAEVAGVPKLTAVKLDTSGAEDFDPFGDSEEHSDEVSLAIDGNVATRWETETYTVGDLQKDGVGLIVNPRAPVAARALDIVTPIPGWTATVYASEDSPDDLAGWTRISGAVTVDDEQRIELDTAGQSFSYYLLWITALPEGEQNAAVAELSLRK
jgi:serine/threonine-protein kinase